MNFTDRKEVVRLFLSEGYQLDEIALDFLTKNTNKIKEILAFLKKSHPTTTTLTHDKIETLFKPKDTTTEILKIPRLAQNTITASATLNYFNIRYDFIKNLLKNRLELTNLTSINKIGRTKQFSLIVLIRDTNHENNKIIVDDKTGVTSVSFDEPSKVQYLLKDEVVGLVCRQSEYGAELLNAIYPNISIRREITKTKEKTICVLLPDLAQDIETPKYLDGYKKLGNEVQDGNIYFFVLGGLPKNAKEFLNHLPKKSKVFLMENNSAKQENTVVLDDPSIIRVGGATLFLSSGTFLKKYEEIFKLPATETLTKLIKKMHLNPTFEIGDQIYENDPFLLDILPNVIAVGSGNSSGSVNYKGITVLATGKIGAQPAAWAINLQTRETIKIDFT